MDTKNIDSKYIANTYARFPLNIVKGKGCYAYDETGKKYIDLGSGIAVNTFGYCDEMWENAVKDQMDTLSHCSNLYFSDPCAKLAQILCEKTGMKKVFFGNSGAEANECAIKVARKYAAEKKGKDYYNIITLVNSFHGRTITTLAATGQDVFHNDFLPLTEGFLYCKANDIEMLQDLVKNYKCAGIMFECVQGEGGVNPLDKKFVQEIDKLCKEQDILMICDEVQTGNGRTGSLYAYMSYGVTPDVFTTAKGLAGGLPLGACIIGEKAENVLTPGSHGSTFGGNPICCAGAISILERIDDTLLQDVKKKNEYILKTLSDIEGVESITGMGLMLGIKTLKDASRVLTECMENGVLVLKAKDKIRLLPPLNISMEDLKEGIEVLKKAISE